MSAVPKALPPEDSVTRSASPGSATPSARPSSANLTSPPLAVAVQVVPDTGDAAPGGENTR